MYQINREFAGYREPHFIVRVRNRKVGRASNRREALGLLRMYEES